MGVGLISLYHLGKVKRKALAVWTVLIRPVDGLRCVDTEGVILGAIRRFFAVWTNRDRVTLGTGRRDFILGFNSDWIPLRSSKMLLVRGLHR